MPEDRYVVGGRTLLSIYLHAMICTKKRFPLSRTGRVANGPDAEVV